MSGRLGLRIRPCLRPFAAGTSYEFYEVERYSSAERAGIQRGDVLRSIDGLSIEGWDLDRITERLRGEAGTLVRLSVLRPVQSFLYVSEVFVQREAPIQSHYQQASWYNQGQAGIFGVNHEISKLGATATNLIGDAISSLTLKSEPMRYGAIDWTDISLPYSGGKCGMSNLGNTCFINAVVQCLVHSVSFANFVVFNPDSISEKSDSAVVKTFANLVGNMWSGEYPSVIPRTFINALKDDARFKELLNHKQQV